MQIDRHGFGRPSAISALETATWPFPIFPKAPQYWRLTPTKCRPCLGRPVSSIANTPRRTGICVRNWVHARAASHGESVMKCCNA
jgi:hypothetical protein